MNLATQVLPENFEQSHPVDTNSRILWRKNVTICPEGYSRDTNITPPNHIPNILLFTNTPIQKRLLLSSVTCIT